MSVPRGQLIGKKVYKPDGSYVGEVADTGFTLGSGASTLIIRVSQEAAIEVPWEKVAAAKDILILSEGTDLSNARQVQLEAESAPAEQGTTSVKSKLSMPVGRILGRVGGVQQAVRCPTCGKSATWIPQYKRWYCYQDKKYV